MRVVLTNFGTTGDVQPLFALAVELRKWGHQPVLALSPNFISRAERLDLQAIPLGPDLQSAQNEANAIMIALPDSTEAIRRSLTTLVESLPQVFKELSIFCRECDLLISGPAQPAARMVHEISGIPFVSVQFSHFGGNGSPALQRASAELINPVRNAVGLRSLRDPLTIDANSPQLSLYAMSRYVRPRQVDWPAHYHLTGFFFLEDETEPVDPGLIDFINADEQPPVVISFGSMPHGNPRTFFDLLVEAVKFADCRAVIQQSWFRNLSGKLPSFIHSTGYVSHNWLLPRASCVVHHGGGGTVGAVFRSGVPSVFVPHSHMFDQYYWAQLAQDLDCAGPPIIYSQLTAERLGTAIKATISSDRYRRSASALARKIRSERGVTRATQLIEQLMHTLDPLCREKLPKPVDTPAPREEKNTRRQQFQLQQRQRKIERRTTTDDSEKRKAGITTP